MLYVTVACNTCQLSKTFVSVGVCDAPSWSGFCTRFLRIVTYHWHWQTALTIFTDRVQLYCPFRLHADRMTPLLMALEKFVRDVQPGISTRRNSKTFEQTASLFATMHLMALSLSLTARLSRISAWRKATIVPRTRVMLFSNATNQMPALVESILRTTVPLGTLAHVRIDSRTGAQMQHTLFCLPP